jgi:hypothetical protein
MVSIVAIVLGSLSRLKPQSRKRSDEVKDHVESLRLLELAQMSMSVHQPESDHIKYCDDCARAFFVLKGAIGQAMVPTFGLFALEQSRLVKGA